MKHFIKKVMLFGLVFVFFISAFLFIISNIHEFSPSEMYYNDEFNKAFSEKDFEVLALGNSKLLSAIDKRILDQNLGLKSVNLGYSSSNISFSKLTLESYLNKCIVKPKIALLEISWFTFNTKRTHLHKISGELFLEDIKLWKNYFYYPGIHQKIISAIFVSLKPLVKDYGDLSYEKTFHKDSPLSKDYKFEIKDFEKVFPNHFAGINELLLEDFKSIINICRENNIELILFTAPEDEEYSKMQKDIKEIKEIFHKATFDYSNVLYLDYTFGGDLWEKKYEMWLANSHHINSKCLFTETLVKDIKVRTHINIYKK